MTPRFSLVPTLIRLGIATLTLCTTVTAQQAAPAAIRFDTTRAREVDSIFARYGSGGSPGCAVAIIDSGRVRYAQGYGLADVASGTRITPASVFGLASITKQFTAMSVLLLAQDHRLSLDDDVRKWVPEVPNYDVPMGKITIRDLLHHTSGIPNYLALLDSGWAITDPMTEHRVLEFLHGKRLDFAPGTQYRYSNSGYVLLEMIVQRVSGKSLRDFARERIFQPLGMRSTGYHDPHRTPAHLASAYISRSTRVSGDQRLIENGPEWQLSNSRTEVLGDAALFSTVLDLARWDANFYSGAVGGPEILRMMEESAVLPSGEPTGYGAGLMLGAYRGLRTIGHLGGWGGYKTWLVRYPDQHFTLAVLCNRRDYSDVSKADANDPSHRIAEIYLGDRMAPAIVPMIADAIERGGADSAVRLYHSLRTRYPRIAFEEAALNALGYRLMTAGKIDAAIAVFRLIVETFPKSANAYDSLGEAYMNHGDKALAITNYERSLALNPANGNAVRMLAKLRGP
jgi:CubicO group peptidase (beta-lactamase class C family)